MKCVYLVSFWPRGPALLLLLLSCLFINTKPGCAKGKPAKKGSPGESKARQIKGCKINRKIISRTKRSQTARLPSGAHTGRDSSPLPLFFGNFFFLLPLREREKAQDISKEPLTFVRLFVRLFSPSVCCGSVPE